MGSLAGGRIWSIAPSGVCFHLAHLTVQTLFDSEARPLCSLSNEINFHPQPMLQDFREEQRAKRRRLLSAAATACIRRGMIRYLQVHLRLTTHCARGHISPGYLYMTC